jgi:GH43 family beta-xylosidase
MYYLTVTTVAGVTLRRARSIAELAQAPAETVWTAPGDSPYVSDIWAPELHTFDGKYYIYAAGNTVGLPQAPQRMFVLEGTSPMGPYVYRATLAGDISGTDPTVLTDPAGGTRYLLWSQFTGTAQCLHISAMANPWTLTGPNVELSCPEYDWEKAGYPINEGPAVLWHGQTLHLVYAASAGWTRDSALGLLTNPTRNIMDPNAWLKRPTPVLQQSEAAGVYGVGQGSFARSATGEEWIVYHAMSDPEGGEANRSTRLQRFTWNADGSPNFGGPVASGAQPCPR